MSDRIRVLHVCDFAAPYPGAFVRQLRMLDDELRARGEGRCAIAVPERAAQAPWLADLRASGMRVELLPEPRTWPTRASVRAIADLIAQTGCDVVHSHFGTYDAAVARAVRAVKRDAPAQVWHYRTALEQPVAERGFVRRAKDVVRYRWFGRDVDRAVAVTGALAHEVAARGMGGRAHAVVAGCDTETFRPDSIARARVRAELGVRDDQLLVLHLGWAWHRKGGDLLAAAARMVGDDDRFVFLSIGASPHDVEAPIRALAPRSAVHEVHQASDVFVSASRSEGFGNGLVEALACERVAVAAVAAGQLEVFAGLPGCRTVAIDDAPAIADALRALADDRARWPELGRANRARIVERHSMRRWAREMADVYGELRPVRGAQGDAHGAPHERASA